MISLYVYVIYTLIIKLFVSDFNYAAFQKL